MLCEAQAELAARAAKPTAEFPLFLDYQDDVLRGGRGRRQQRAGRRADDRRQAGAREPSSTGSRTLAAEKLARPVRGPREGDRRRLPLADQEAGPPADPARQGPHRRPRPHRHPHALGRGRGASRGCTARRCSSAARPRSSGVTTLNMLRMEQQLDTLSPETPQALHAQLQLPAVLAPVRPAGSARPSVARSATARSPSGRSCRCCRPREEFPYAIRQVSEALGSNGSTSMGSVCASTMSLLNAGVPLRAPVAGIAMGLVSDTVDGETAVRRADRHPRRRGRVRRHGLQGRRHQGVRHRAPAGHQARRHPRLGAGRRADAGQGRPAARSST